MHLRVQLLDGGDGDTRLRRDHAERVTRLDDPESPPGRGFFVVTVPATVVEICLGEVTGTVIDAGEPFPPASRPEWINTIAIVAASKNAPGAA